MEYCNTNSSDIAHFSQNRRQVPWTILNAHIKVFIQNYGFAATTQSIYSID